MTNPTVFDQTQFSSLIEDDAQLANTLLELLIQESPKILKGIDLAIEQKAYDDIEKLGHKIKGTLRNFFAEKAAKVAADIEEGGRQKDFEKIYQANQQLKPLVDEVILAVTEFCKTLK